MCFIFTNKVHYYAAMHVGVVLVVCGINVYDSCVCTCVCGTSVYVPHLLDYMYRCVQFEFIKMWCSIWSMRVSAVFESQKKFKLLLTRKGHVA